MFANQLSLFRRIFTAGAIIYALGFVVLLAFHPVGSGLFDTIFDICEITPHLFAGLSCLLYACRGPHTTPARRIGWFLISMACFCYLAGDGIWWFYTQTRHGQVPFPSWADAAWLAVFPFLIGGILLLLGAAPSVGRARLLMDSAITVSSIALLSWHFLVQQLWVRSGISMLARCVSIAPPMADVAVLFCAFVLVSTLFPDKVLRRSVLLLAGGITLWSFADILYGYARLHDYYHTGSWFDWGWPFGALMIGFGARLPQWMQPTAAPADTEIESERLAASGRSLARIVAPYIAIGIALATVMYDEHSHHGKISESTFCVGLGLLVLIMARQVLTLMENRTMAVQLGDLLVEARQAQKELQQARDELEQRVQERTAALQAEVVERKQAEQALRESESRLRLALDAAHQAEEELLKIRKAVEHASDAISIREMSGQMIFVNRAFEDLFGMTADALNRQGGPEVIYVDPAQRQRMVAQIERGSSWSGELEVFDRNGNMVPVSVRADAIRDEQGNLIAAIAAFTDITERKRLEAQVIQSEKLAALGELVAGVAHEINNPIAVISANAQLLEMHPDEKVKQRGDTIRRMTERATRIVRSLLTFAHQTDDERKPTSLNEVVEAALEMCSYKLKKTDVDLQIQLSEETPCAHINDNQIQQVLLNLINNAEHAVRRSPEGQRRIVVATHKHCCPEGMEWAQVSVADNGCGMSEEVRKRIFDPFFTTKDVGEGTGLGLSICHGIVEAHRGVLSVESQVGVGTTFTLLLPTGKSKDEG